jgi:hypothetical protein
MKEKFFSVVLPLVWAIVSFISYFHPGDEYRIYAYSNIIGIWIFFFTNAIDIYSLLFPALTASIGAVFMALVGLGLDRLHGSKKLWLLLWAAASIFLFVYAVAQYPTLQKALSKNGSWTAYIAGALNLGLYVSVFLTALIKVIQIIFKKHTIPIHTVLTEKKGDI